jgi:hypothetical protein
VTALLSVTDFVTVFRTILGSFSAENLFDIPQNSGYQAKTLLVECLVVIERSDVLSSRVDTYHCQSSHEGNILNAVGIKAE